MKIGGVVFDLDHTLFDRYATLRAVAPEFCRMLTPYIAKGLSAEKAARLLCEGDSRYIYYGWRRVFAFLCDNGMFDTQPTYEEYKSTLLSLFSRFAVPYPFTYTALEKVKKRGLKTGLITNGSKEIQASKLKLLGLERYFDAIILCGELGVQKPDPLPFSEMARMLGVEADTLLYVGDNPICDVDGSRRAGYIPVQVMTAECVLPDAEPAKYRIASVDELDGLIEALSVTGYLG